MFNIPDLTPLFYMAAFGLFCAVVIVLVGIPAGIWYLAHHLAWH